MPYTIYQAGPLFSEAEKNFHKTLSARLRAAGHEVIWPGDLLTDDQIESAGPTAPELIFNTCRQAIDRCNLVTALLDGPQVDDGTAWEIGYAYAKGIPIYGLRTDFRQAGDTRHNYANSMIQGCLAGVAKNVEELVEMLKAGQHAD
jgi:nucleoside 2-deoxyribosyltransferase